MSNGEIGKALAGAFADIDHAVKNSVNPHFKSTYANLAEVLDVIRRAFKGHGLAVVQLPGELKLREGFATVSITTTIIHASGEMIGAAMDMPVNADKNGKYTPHAVGSAITFGRRYALAAACGITQEDDDGNAGSETVEEDESPVDDLRAQISEATTSVAVKALQALVGETGDAELVAYFTERYKGLLKKEKGGKV